MKTYNDWESKDKAATAVDDCYLRFRKWCLYFWDSLNFCFFILFKDSFEKKGKKYKFKKWQNTPVNRLNWKIVKRFDSKLCLLTLDSNLKKVILGGVEVSK